MNNFYNMYLNLYKIYIGWEVVLNALGSMF